jgi:hypothetical protein
MAEAAGIYKDDRGQLRWARPWRGPRLCHDCREPIDYAAGKWMSVEVQAGRKGQAARMVTVCTRCWRANHRPRPAPAATGIVAELAALLAQAVDRRVSLRFTRPTAWVEGRAAAPLAGGAEEDDGEER